MTTDVVDDGSVDTLVAAAADAEMLVLGARGTAAVVGFLLGSVGQQVIAEATSPVVLVRAGDQASAEAAGREIVVGQHGDPEDSAAVLRFAFETAAARGATVRAVRAWTLPPRLRLQPGLAEAPRRGRRPGAVREEVPGRGAAALAGALPRSPVVEHVEMGSAGQVLLSVAGRAQLMVVGRRARRTAVGARIGSVAHGVLHHAACPVAVVPPV